MLEEKELKDFTNGARGRMRSWKPESVASNVEGNKMGLTERRG